MPSVSLPAVMMGVSAAGAVVGGVGQYENMKAQSENAAYQSQVAANNAKIAQQNAALETESGEVAAANYGMKTRSVVGTTKAQQGASGVDVNSGSSVAVRAGEAELGTLDALTIRSNAARKAYGYTVAATGDTASSQLLASQSQQASDAAPLSALSSILGSASSSGSALSKYMASSGSPGGSGTSFGTTGT